MCWGGEWGALTMASSGSTVKGSSISMPISSTPSMKKEIMAMEGTVAQPRVGAIATGSSVSQTICAPKGQSLSQGAMRPTARVRPPRAATAARGARDPRGRQPRVMCQGRLVPSSSSAILGELL